MTGIIATSSAAEVEIASGDELYVPETVRIAVVSGRGVDSDTSGTNNRRVVIDGTVVSTGNNGIRLVDNAEDEGFNYLLIGREGTVRTLNIGGIAAVWVLGSNSFIDNAGEASGVWGLYVQDYDGSSIVNSGLASGAASNSVAAGILVETSAGVLIQNSGVVTGGNGVISRSSDFTLRNTGEISGVVGAGIDASQQSPTGGVKIVSSGVVTGAAAAIIGTEFGDVVRNAGLMSGDVELGAGDDRYAGGQGVVDGVVKGDGGEDDLRGGAKDDVFRGGTENDALRGRRGDDSLYGDAGDDVLQGGRGDDFLFGGAGDDVIRGGRGDDEVNSGGGRDVVVIRRGNGDDRIVQFANNRDKVDLKAFGFDNFKQVERLAERADGGVLIDLEGHGGGSVWLGGLDLAKFNAGDLIL